MQMMAFIVRCDDARGWLAGPEHEDELETGIPEAAAENRQVHVIVCDDAANKCEQTGKQECERMTEQTQPNKT